MLSINFVHAMQVYFMQWFNKKCEFWLECVPRSKNSWHGKRLQGGM